MQNIQVHRIAIIGSGAIAQRHAQILSELPNVVFAGCCDAGSGRGAALCHQYGGRHYADWQSVMADDAVDMVIVATPSGRHMEPAVAAARAGKHVLCEKPLEITMNRVHAMIAAHEAAGTRLGGIFQNRFTEAMGHLRGAIAENRFGRITHTGIFVPWWRSADYYKGTWRGTWEVDGGGAMMNQAIHMIDMLIALRGEPVEVKALAGTLAHSIEAEDTCTAAVRFSDGSLGTIVGSTASWPGHPKRLEITGNEGTAVLVEDKLTVWEFQKKREQDEQISSSDSGQRLSGGSSNPMDIGNLYLKRNVQAFLDSIDSGGPFELNGREAAKAVKLVLQLYADSGINRT